MKTRFAFRPLLLASSILMAHSAHAANYYWDTDGATSGLGNTAGNWGTNAFFLAVPNGIISGASATNVSATSSADAAYFGTNNLALGATASTIGIAGGGVTINTIVFGAGQGSQGVTLSGGGGTITLAGTGPSSVPTITTNNSGTNTIGAVLAGTAGLVKSGSGTLVLTGGNNFTGGVTINGGGTLQIGNGTSGSLSSQVLTFSNGGGVFNVRSLSTGSTQAMGALTFSTTGAGDGTVQSTYGTSGNASLTFSSLAARGAGATGNFIVSGGANGTTNQIVLTGATSNAFIDKGLFFGGSSYAYYDSSGYVRAMNYDGLDTDTEVSGTITTSKHVQISATPASQNSISLLSLNLSGGGVDWTQNAAQTLTVPAILKSGGGAASTISGGTGLTTASNAELVIRTDTASDLLTISTAVTGFSGGLTKTGTGTLTLSGANDYTGATTINAGTLALSGGSAIVDTGAVALANASSAVLQLNNNETIGQVSGGGFSGGNVNVGANTLTIANANSQTFGGKFIGTGGVTIASGTLNLSNKNSFAGTISLLGTSQLNFTYGQDGTAYTASASSGGTISMAGGTTLGINPTAQVALGVAGGSQTGVVGGNLVGEVVSNPISASSAGTITIKHLGQGTVRGVFSGNVTGVTGGSSTLALIQGAGGGNAERTTLTMSGIIQDGASGGSVGVSADFTAANSTNQGAFICLTGQNTFTGPIVVSNTKGLIYGGASAYQGAWFVIGGEITSTFSDRTVTPGTGALGWNGSVGNYSGAISLASGTILNYMSSATQTLGGAITGGGNMVKEGSGLLTLSNANTFTGTTTITTGKIAMTNPLALQNSAYVTTGSNGTTIGLDVSGGLSSGTLTLGGLAGAVNLASAITAGYTGSVTGLILNTQAGASHTYSGVIANGFGTMTLTKSGTGTQTLQGVNTYSGATSVQGGTLGLSGSGSILNTSAISLDGGTGLTLTNTVAETGAGRLPDAIGIQVNGSTITYTNTAGANLNYAETLGNVTLASGPTSFVLTNNQNNATNNSQTLILGGLIRTGASNTSVAAFLAGGTGPQASGGDNMIRVNGVTASTGAGQILGPWATTGVSTTSQSDYARYVSDGTNGFIAPAGITHSLESTWTAAANSYTFNGATAKAAAVLSGTRNMSGLKLETVSSATGAADSATERVTWTGHALVEGAPFFVGGTVTGGLTAGNVYYARNVTANDFQISATPTGAIIDLTNTTSIAALSPGVLVSTGNNLGTTGILSTQGVTNAITATGSGVVTLPNTNSDFLYVTTAGPGASNILISASIADNGAGVLTLVKSGIGGGTAGTQGVLTLAGANTFTGGTVLNAGTLSISANNNLGAAFTPITVNGNSRITTTAPSTVDYTRAISLNNGATLSLSNTSTSTATFSGAITGTGGISVAQGTNTTIALSSNSNTFTGNLSLPSTTFNDFLSFSSIGDGGLISIGKGSWRGVVQYTGSSNLALNNRQISLNSSFANVVDGSGFPINAFENNSTAGSVTFNTNMLVAEGRTGTFAFGGTNTANNTFSGTIPNSTGGTLSIWKHGTGTWALTGINTYAGTTTVSAGTLAVSTLADGGSPSSIGISSNAAGSLILNGGTLRYTGAAVTSDRLFSLQSSSSIDSSGSGALNLNNTGSMGFNGGTAAKTLTLTGSNAGNNILAAAITNNTGATTVTKSGVGTWVLTNPTSTYTGGTNVNGGTLLLNGAVNLPTTGTLAVAAGGNFSVADGTVRNTTAATLTLASGSLLSFDWSSAGTVDNLAPTAAITPGSGAAVGIIINPIGTPTGGGNLLTGITGSTLNNPNYFLANNTNFTATITKPGAGAGSVSIGSYAAATALTNAYWRGGLTNAVGAMAYSNGGNTSTSSNWFSSAAGASAAGVVPGGSAVNVIFGATGGSNQSAVTTGADINLASITFNDTAAVTIAGSNTITLNSASGTAAATTAALATVTAGSAISVTQYANAANTISANVALGANQTWNVANNKTLTVSGTVYGAGFSLTKADAGTLALSGANAYTGGTTISVGTIQANNSFALGSGAVSVASGAKLMINANSVTMANNIALNGTTTNGALYSGDRPAGNVTHLTGTITLNATSNISTWWNDKTLQISGKITGSGGLSMDLQPGSVGGRYYITGAGNDYAGTTTVAGSATGQFGYTGQAMLYLGANNALPVTSALTLNNADLYLNGQSQTLPSISGSGSFSVQNGSTTASTLTLGSGNATSTFSGSLKDNGISVTNTSATPATVVGTVAFAKIGTGTLTLANTNTYTGATTVSAGTLEVGSAGTINTTSGITVAAGAQLKYNSSTALTVAPVLNGAGVGSRAVLSGTGTINASLTLDNLGDTLSPGNSPGVQTFTPAQTWSSLSYDWELNDWVASSAGTNLDKINITGTLDLSAVAAGSYELNILSLAAGNVTGDIANFAESSNSWTILTASGGISGFSASEWILDASGFTNAETGTWSISQNTNDLVLTYTAIPEPAAALLGGLGMLLILRRRR